MPVRPHATIGRRSARWRQFESFMTSMRATAFDISNMAIESTVSSVKWITRVVITTNNALSNELAMKRKSVGCQDNA